MRPAELLTPPSDAAGIPDFVNGILGAPDLLSPSGVVAELTKAVLGVDPLAYAADHLTGDWPGVARTSSAVRNLAAFAEAVSATLADQTQTVRAAWHGSAADAASSYFGGLATAVSDGAPALERLARELHTVAAAVWNVAETVKGLLQVIFDWAIAMAVSTAAGTALVETVFGPVVGYTIAAYCAGQMEAAWAKALECLGKAVTAAKALVALLGTLLTRLEPAGGFPLPASPFDDSGVS